MLKIKRGNVILRIPDTDKQHYLLKGYEVIGKNGEVIETMKKDTSALEKENAELRALVEKLKADLKDATAPQMAEAPVEETEEAEEPKQVKSKKKK